MYAPCQRLDETKRKNLMKKLLILLSFMVTTAAMYKECQSQADCAAGENCINNKCTLS